MLFDQFAEVTDIFIRFITPCSNFGNGLFTRTLLGQRRIKPKRQDRLDFVKLEVGQKK